jgi:hypothetical protein
MPLRSKLEAEAITLEVSDKLEAFTCGLKHRGKPWLKDPNKRRAKLQST